MRILIVGATGMLGHVLLDIAQQQPEFEVFAGVRQRNERTLEFLNTDPERVFECNLLSEKSIDYELFCSPEAVINCAGIVRHLHPEHSESNLIRINALAPHLLSEYCDRIGARLIQLSTDCVFSGKKGKYSEDDLPDPPDSHGRMKLIGEIHQSPHLTIRTSFIGHESSRERKYYLLDWFLGQNGVIGGYTKALWSGLTTLEISNVIVELIKKQDVSGILHIYGETLSKYDLLGHIQSEYKKSDVVIQKDESFECDRSLTSSRFADIGIKVPRIQQMITELREYYLARNIF